MPDMLLPLLAALGIPLALVVGGIVAFVMLPIKLGIAVAVLAFIAAAGLCSWMMGGLDFSH